MTRRRLLWHIRRQLIRPSVWARWARRYPEPRQRRVYAIGDRVMTRSGPGVIANLYRYDGVDRATVYLTRYHDIVGYPLTELDR
jgi:hypothetical protein